MTAVLFIYLLSLAGWLGAMAFFSFFTAPVLFAQLPVADAGRVLSVIFPRYYELGYVAGTAGCALAIYLAAVARGSRGWWGISAAALGLALAGTLYAGLAVRPRVDALRPAAGESSPDPARKAEFARLHRVSVILNGAVFLLDLAALFGTARALAPRG